MLCSLFSEYCNFTFTSQFLSMKLEAVNSRLTPGIDVFPPKDVSIEQHPYIFISNSIYTDYTYGQKCPKHTLVFAK